MRNNVDPINEFRNMTTKEKIIVIMAVAPLIAFKICAFIPLVPSDFTGTNWSIADGIIYIALAEIVFVSIIIKYSIITQRIINSHNMALSHLCTDNSEESDDDISDDVLLLPEELLSDRGYSALNMQSKLFKVLSIAFLALYCICIIMTLIKDFSFSETNIFANVDLTAISLFLILLGTAFSAADTFFNWLMMKAEEKYYENC